jgi:hypothetical protein
MPYFPRCERQQSVEIPLKNPLKKQYSTVKPLGGGRQEEDREDSNRPEDHPKAVLAT